MTRFLSLLLVNSRTPLLAVVSLFIWTELPLAQEIGHDYSFVVVRANEAGFRRAVQEIANRVAHTVEVPVEDFAAGDLDAIFRQGVKTALVGIQGAQPRNVIVFLADHGGLIRNSDQSDSETGLQQISGATIHTEDRARLLLTAFTEANQARGQLGRQPVNLSAVWFGGCHAGRGRVVELLSGIWNVPVIAAQSAVGYPEHLPVLPAIGGIARPRSGIWYTIRANEEAIPEAHFRHYVKYTHGSTAFMPYHEAAMACRDRNGYIPSLAEMRRDSQHINWNGFSDCVYGNDLELPLDQNWTVRYRRTNGEENWTPSTASSRCQVICLIRGPAPGATPTATASIDSTITTDDILLASAELPGNGKTNLLLDTFDEVVIDPEIERCNPDVCLGEDGSACEVGDDDELDVTYQNVSGPIGASLTDAAQVDLLLDLYYEEVAWRNYLGHSERWLAGLDEVGSTVWYLLTPDGILHEWTGESGVGQAVAQLDPIFHASPRLLFDWGSPDIFATADEALGLWIEIVEWRNGLSLGERWLAGVDSEGATVWYLLLPNGGLSRWDGTGAGAKIASLGSLFYERPALLINATSADRSYWLDFELGLYTEIPEWQNVLGYQEKWIGGTGASLETVWYLLLPNGKLHSYDETAGLGSLVFIVAPSVYSDPAVLIHAAD